MSAVLPKCAGLFVIGSRMGAIVLCSGVLPLTFGGPQLSQLTGPRIGAWVWLKRVFGPARQITAASAPAQKQPPTEKDRSFESFSFIDSKLVFRCIAKRSFFGCSATPDLLLFGAARRRSRR